MIVLRKNISVEKGQEKLFEEYRYFFYITNDRASTAEQIVFTGQRPLRSGEPDRATQERRARDAQSAGQSASATGPTW